MTPSRWQQTEDLYHAALGCEQGEREALLARADPELRREVESLLAQQSTATPFDHPAWQGAASSLGSTVASLTPGTRLGPYKIEGPLGSGGMGEVFRAVDTRLARPVAIKISQAQFNARFEREARAISSLNHPHICTLFDVGPNYLVMELCEGETLAARLKRGKLSIQDTLHYSQQIADALAAAHSLGIIHRDLKPGNIMLTKNGVKVLDFGLAKSPEDEVLTASRVVMGTPAYMAPEQALGLELDARADLFSLGVVMYEMATGKRPFQGDTSMATTDAILHKAPTPPSQSNPSIPVGLEQVIENALEKDRDMRYQTATGILADLKRLLRDMDRQNDSGRRVPVPTPVVAPRDRRQDPKKRLRDIGEVAYLLDDGSVTAPSPARLIWVAWAVASLAIACASWLALVHFREQPPSERSLRFQIPLPEKLANVPSQISPDGRYLVFSERGDGPLWVRSLTSLAAQPLAGTGGAFLPFWSPDSKSIGFFAGGKLQRIDVGGGAVLTLADTTGGRGGTWGLPDGSGGNSGGVILFTPTANGPILRVSAGGGTASLVTKLRPGEISHRLPWFLPDGRHFFYSATNAANIAHNTIHVGDLSSPEDTVIGEADSQAVYSQGFLLFLRQETLMAQPFDAQRRVATGDAVPLEQQILRRSVPAYADFSTSTNGLLAFSAGSAGGNLQLTWVDRGGKQLGPLGEPGIINHFHFSPDRKHVAVALGPSGTLNNAGIWIYDAARGLRTRFTFDPAAESFPVWSPDGHSIIFASTRNQHLNLYRKSSDGAGAEELLYSDNLEKTPTSWSPDDKFLLYHANGAGVGRNAVWVLPLTPERPGAPLKPFPFAPAPFDEHSAQFSPDGRWIAYVSNESQRNQVYVARFPGAGDKRQISVAGGINPRWRRDGKEIFYVALDRKIMSAAVNVKGDALEVAQVRPLFGPLSVADFYYYGYDVSADGLRFLILPPPQTSGEGVTVVQNWTAGLKK